MDPGPLGPEAEVIERVLIGLAAAIIGAVILRGACCLLNKAARRKHAQDVVPVPDFDRALLTCLVLWLASSGAESILNPPGGRVETWSTILRLLIGLAVQYLVAVVVVAGFLPTTFRRAAVLILAMWAIATPAVALSAVIFFLVIR